MTTGYPKRLRERSEFPHTIGCTMHVITTETRAARIEAAANTSTVAALVGIRTRRHNAMSSCHQLTRATCPTQTNASESTALHDLISIVAAATTRDFCVSAFNFRRIVPPCDSDRNTRMLDRSTLRALCDDSRAMKAMSGREHHTTQ